jgi:hypothetical protein
VHVLLLFAGGFGGFMLTLLALLGVTLVLIAVLVAVAWGIGVGLASRGRRRRSLIHFLTPRRFTLSKEAKPRI